MAKKLIPFSWYGGKFSHLNFLLPLLPNDCKHYCEPYGGSGAVLLNRESAPLETYNDIDAEVVTFFKVLREQTDELLRLLQLTPYSRLEFERAIAEPTENLCELERARRFFVRASQVFSGIATGRKNWSCRPKNGEGNILADLQRGDARSRRLWSSLHIAEGKDPERIHRLDSLELVAARLLRVQLECLPAQEIIQKYDSPATLFYVDPPYTWLGAYIQNADAWQGIQLAEQLRRVQGRVAISGYSTEFHENLYQGWRRVLGPVKGKPAGQGVGGKSGKKAREALWMNYDEEGKKFT